MVKHTILFLAANPAGTDRLALDAEARSIEEELERSDRHARFVFATRWAVEPLDLLRGLRKLKPTVVHYSGHGEQEGLCFQCADGGTHPVSPQAIAQTFGAAGSAVRVVVLSACYSEAHAQALLAHVDCVVGFAGPVMDEAARSFAIGFYGGLGAGESIAAAYRQGCAAMVLDESRDRRAPPVRDVITAHDRPHNTGGPRLVIRPDVDASQIVLGADAAQARPRRRVSAAVIASFGGLIAGGYFVVSRAQPTPERATEAPPPGMVTLAAADLDLGSTSEEISAAMAGCRALPASECRADLYARERPHHRAHVSTFALDAHERSNADVAAWLTELHGLTFENEWLVNGGVRLAEVGEDHALRRMGARIVAKPGTEQLPAVDITYDGARGFCRARGLDLPTEAQWERAARGTERRLFPWGDAEPTCDRAIYGGEPGGPCANQGPSSVSAVTGDRTPEGIVNLGGNVSEWVLDRYFDGGYVACPAPCTDPLVAATADPHEAHVIRGGDFASSAQQLRGAGRARAPRDAAFANTGFRCSTPPR